jgi:hypothetical protein
MLEELITYMELHLISLEQDSEAHEKYMDTIYNYDSDEWETAEIEDISINGQIIATQHLLSVARDILRKTHKGDRHAV